MMFHRGRGWNGKGRVVVPVFCVWPPDQGDRIPLSTPAILALADGTVFRGLSIGAPGQSVGEVVFNTAMTGYQEILTDPSYARQIVTLHDRCRNTRGNTPCRWRAAAKGAQAGCIMARESIDADAAIEAARAFPGLAGADVAREVSTREPYHWSQGTWTLEGGLPYAADPDAARFHVVAYDYGIKRNILRLLAAHGSRVTVVPAETPAEEVLALEPDGVFLSNGPGDPEPCGYAIEAIRTIMERDIPVFGICLGHQLLGLAGGARSVKMKFGHHGANHPVKDLDTGRVMISSQNHGFAVDADTLPSTLRVTHVSLFDDSLQGIHHTDKPAFSFQGHPEASPGPMDSAYLFERFARGEIDEAEFESRRKALQR